MKIISYSLYGNLKRYTDPLIYNASNLSTFYKGWVINVYHDDSVPKDILDFLKNNGVCLINISTTNFSNFAPKFWRFLPVFDDKNELVIFRDSDSVFTEREVALVNQWLESDFNFHIIRDHQLHISPILAGMFGIKRNYFKFFTQQLISHISLVKSNFYNADQIFLGDFIYKKVIRNTLIHTSYFAFFNENYVRINKSIEYNDFIGAIYTEKQNKIDLVLEYDFIIGLPFCCAKFLRYKVRPVLYLSYIYNLITNFK